MRFLCKIGLHKWKYTPAVYATPMEERLALPSTPSTRACQCCLAKQVEDRHCLGMNPPEFSVNWRNWHPARVD